MTLITDEWLVALEKPAPAPCLYILCGLAFAGKSTLVREMVMRSAGRLALVSLDAINGESGLGLDGRRILPAEWDMTYAEAYRRIGVLLAEGRSVIFDATSFTRRQRDELRAIAAPYNAATQVIYVTTPEAVARERLHRNREMGSRADVRDDDFALVVDALEPPGPNESPLLYDAL
ncbi:MAG: ATP-binding protein [Ktedonobacterales bacterium]